MSFLVVNYHKPIIVAEIGCNHGGKLENAFELINLAKQSGADCVKFQKRDNKLLPANIYNTPHPNPLHSYGENYGKHREFLEFNIEQHKELKDYCQSINIQYSCSVWDINSAKDIISINPQYIKIPSACNTQNNLLKTLINEYEGDIHLSLGMTTRAEIDSIVKLFNYYTAQKRLTLYSCTSAYPVCDTDAALLEINYLLKSYGKDIKAVGFSGHHVGISLDIAAFTLGASWIERHFTQSHSLKGTDHQASLEPDELFQLSSNLNSVFRGLKYKSPDILPTEKEQLKKLKSIYSSELDKNSNFCNNN